MIAFTSLLNCLLTFCDGSGFQCFGGLSVFKSWFKQFSNLNTWISAEGRWDSAVILQAVVQTGSSTKDKEYVSQTTSLLLLGDRLIDQHWTHARKKKLLWWENKKSFNFWNITNLVSSFLVKTERMFLFCLVYSKS